MENENLGGIIKKKHVGEAHKCVRSARKMYKKCPYLRLSAHTFILREKKFRPPPPRKQ